MMLATAALLCLGSIDPSHFAGTLTDEQNLADAPVAQLSREQLLAEQSRLQPHRTGFIAPVVFTAVGGVLLIVGVGSTLFGIIYAYIPSLIAGASTSFFTALGIAFIAFGGAALIAGGVLLTIGLVKLFPALARRREASTRLEEIQQRLQQLDAPPPPPNPGDVRHQGPAASMLLATF